MTDSPLMVCQLTAPECLYPRQCLPNEYLALFRSIANYFVPLGLHVPNEETIQVEQKWFFHRLSLRSAYPLSLLLFQHLGLLFQLPKYSCHASINFKWFSLIIL